MAKKQFKAESKRLLDLMINSIYTHKEIFLREIISNASDAIDKLCYLSLTDDKVGLSREDFKIVIRADKEKRTITVSDNGIGMTAADLESNLGVIAKSGSLQFKKEMEQAGEKTEDIDIIGQFGVGFYSAFMVAEKVTVISRAYGNDTASCWVSSGADGYTISECEKDTVGTDVIMELKPDSDEEKYSDFLEEFELRALVKKYSDYVRWPIVIGEQVVNSQIPIWQRSKSEVSEEDCIKFYKDRYYDSEDPAAVIRVNAEGAVSYKAMLFIPTKAPFDYYTREYQAGLSLYTSGVMIMDKCPALLPDYFRFVRGIVDSQDLSLNISRELLQHDRQLKIIASNLEKKIKSELEKLMEKEPDKYNAFYKAFGLQLKYGTVSDFGAHRDMLSDLLMFYSHKEEKLISLKQYTEHMPEDQKYIYYACGDSISRLKNLPQTEPIKEKGYDILYLTDDVDEFVVQILGKFNEKDFRSVNEDDLGLDTEADSKQAEKTEEENKALLDFIKDNLNGEVAAVKVSRKLKSYPVCLTTQGEISLEMEKYFASLPNAQPNAIKAERVLELNASHPVFASLQKAFAEDPDKAKKYAKLLYSQALLIAGIPLEDPAEFSELICELM